MAATNRVIMHLDMDAFFVNCELLAQPELRGKRIIVARDSERSVVLSASYEARKFGVRSAMPLARAKQLCPSHIVVEPSAHYRDYSHKVMLILKEITDQVEQVSVDEAFVDLTPTLRRLGNPVDTAQLARKRILEELGLPCSAGISSNKFIAKMASSGSKPNGLWVIPPHRIQEFLDPLPVGKLWGVGPKSAQAIESLGIHTVQQLRNLELGYLIAKFGRSSGAHLYRIARGLDDRPVITERVEKSIGAEHTFSMDTHNVDELSRAIFSLSLAVGKRLRNAKWQTRSLSLKIRYDTFETLTRSCVLHAATDSGQQMHRAIMKKLTELGLISESGIVMRPIRLIGVRAEKLETRSSGIQESLLGEDLALKDESFTTDWHLAETMMDEIQDRFGSASLMPANFFSQKKS